MDTAKEDTPGRHTEAEDVSVSRSVPPDIPAEFVDAHDIPLDDVVTHDTPTDHDGAPADCIAAPETRVVPVRPRRPRLRPPRPTQAQLKREAAITKMIDDRNAAEAHEAQFRRR